MQFQTTIDDKLYQQAVSIIGLANKQDFWEALQRFRASTDLDELGDIDEVFTDVRSQDSGRVVDL